MKPVYDKKENIRVKVLVLGATGMLGHKLLQVMQERFDALGTTRRGSGSVPPICGVKNDLLREGVDVLRSGVVQRTVQDVSPDVVVNCVGIIKQHQSAEDPALSIRINALFPHELSRICKDAGARLIHMSTDCVFSGRKGMYTESDEPAPVDLYGRTKLLGEVDGEHCLTLRTSIIGHELDSRYGLLEWFLSNRGANVNGFVNAIYSGFPTVVLAGILCDLIESRDQLSGVWHVSSEPINKFELLCLIRDAYGVDIEVNRDKNLEIDRSLDSSRFRNRTGFQPLSWAEMIRIMKEDAVSYEHWR